MTQPRDNTGMEELVEEAKDKVVNQLYAVLEYVEEAEDDDHRHRQLEIWADWIIEGISQAIAEGKVKVAGEKARWPNDYQTIWDFTNTALETGCELIALCKEGTEAEEMLGEYAKAAELNRTLAEEHMEAFEEVVGKEEEK